MPYKSTSEQYGLTAQRYHWLSALLIISMIPLGIFMQNVESEASKIVLYRGHVLVGFLVLLTSVLRVFWRRKDINPDPPEGLHGVHLKAFNAIHVLLYVFIFVLALSGMGTVMLSEVGAVLSGSSAGQLPTDLSEIGARRAHGVAAWIYVALLGGHIGGVVFHQLTKSDVLGRMGVRFSTRENLK